MSNSAAELRALVEKAEAELANNQSRYRTHLLWYSLLGYVAIFGLLALLAFLVAGTVGLAVYSTAFLLLLLKKKLIIPVLVLGWVLLKALWVKFEPPTGFHLTRAHAPALFAELEELRLKLKTPPIHQVILTPVLNAAIAQTPRLGIFGWPTNTLILGLELLLVLSPAEARAVVAHELGHLSGNHSRFAAWVYRSRLSWERIMNSINMRGGLGAGMLRKFFNWYAPRFAAYSFALARLNEYEADAISAELTSRQTATNALVNTFALAPYLENSYWERYYESAEHHPVPQHPPYIGLTQFISTSPPASAALQSRISEALEWKTSYDDTHPSLADRIKALGGIAEPSLRSGPCAAEEWLGASFQKIVEHFDREWMAHNETRWKEHYDAIQADKAELARVRAIPAEQRDKEQAWSFARFSELYDKEVDALELYRRYLEVYANDPPAEFAIGRILLARGDEAGLHELRKVIDVPDACIPACRVAYVYLMERKREAEAAEWRDIANRRLETDELAKRERAAIGADDSFDKPTVTSELVERIAAHFKAQPQMKSLWLAQKRVQHYPERPLLVVAVKLREFSRSRTKLRILHQLMAEINVPVEIFGVTNVSQHKAVYVKIVKHGIHLS